MTKQLRVFVGLYSAGLVVLFASSASASLFAHDSASDAVYNDGWQPGDNGGTGWGGGWTFRNQNNTVLTTTDSNRGWFVASSLGNNQPPGNDSNGDGDINTSGNKAWGVYSNASDQVYAIRPLSGALAVGQTVSWYMDNGNISSGQVVGLRFLSNANDVNSRVFEARFVGGDSNYSLVANPNQLTTIGFTREGLRLDYTLTSASTFSLTITRLQNNVVQTLTGTNLAGSIMALAFKNQFAGTGESSDGFLNSITVSAVPEVSAFAFFGVATAISGVIALRRRKPSPNRGLSPRD